MKELFLDLETTGRNPYKSGITEVSASVFFDGVKTGDFHEKLQPHVGAFVEDEALVVQGITRTDLASPSRKTNSAGFTAFESFLSTHVNRYEKTDKFFFIAHNAKFDSEFVEEWFKRNSNRYYGSFFHRPYICTYILSCHKMRADWPSMPDHKLATIARTLGVEVKTEELHSSAYDVQLCKAVYDKLQEVK